MANNIAVSPGSGATVATDETTIGGTAVQVHRMTTGAAPSWSHANVAVTSTATLILAASTARKGFAVKAIGGPIYVGSSSGVTTTTGWPLYDGESYSSSAYLGTVYAITASGVSANLRYSEES